MFKLYKIEAINSVELSPANRAELVSSLSKIHGDIRLEAGGKGADLKSLLGTFSLPLPRFSDCVILIKGTVINSSEMVKVLKEYRFAIKTIETILEEV